MKKIISYSEHLLQYLDSDEAYLELLGWIEHQPELDQPDILRQLAVLLKERYEKTGETDYLEKAKLLEDGVDEFEEGILDEKLFKQMLIMAIEKADFDLEKFTMLLNYIRETIIETILSNSEITEEIWNVAENAIKLEKKSGLYDPENWSAINL